MFAARLILLTLVFIPMSIPVDAGLWDSFRGMFWKTHTKAAPMIDVLIVNDKPEILLEVKGRYQLIDPLTKQLISKRYMGKKKNLKALSSGLKWGEEFPGIFQLQIVPENTQSSIFVDNIEYRGTLYIYDIGGSISIVNRVPVEEYLLATLPEKFPESLQPEVLAAIAITARTDAFYQAQNPKNRYWALDGRSSGYRGLNSHLPETDMVQAICATRHMVLSKTGTYEGVVTPFPASWDAADGAHLIHQNGGKPRISISDAQNMAERGSHAAQILSKAYPGSHIEIIY